MHALCVQCQHEHSYIQTSEWKNVPSNRGCYSFVPTCWKRMSSTKTTALCHLLSQWLVEKNFGLQHMHTAEGFPENLPSDSETFSFIGGLLSCIQMTKLQLKLTQRVGQTGHSAGRWGTIQKKISAFLQNLRLQFQCFSSTLIWHEQQMAWIKISKSLAYKFTSIYILLKSE